jgi:hypothetical protein
MAIDTRNKRASAMNLMCPWRGAMPAPDGAIGDGDRATSVLLYSGILASVVVINAARLEFTLPPNRLDCTVPDERCEWTLPRASEDFGVPEP